MAGVEMTHRTGAPFGNLFHTLERRQNIRSKDLAVTAAMLTVKVSRIIALSSPREVVIRQIRSATFQSLTTF